MSWSAYASNITRDEIANLQPNTPLSSEPEEQFEAAQKAAIALVDSQIIGDPARHRFNVSLAGHANPSHELAERSSVDSVSVSVSQSNVVEQTESTSTL